MNFKKALFSTGLVFSLTIPSTFTTASRVFAEPADVPTKGTVDKAPPHLCRTILIHDLLKEEAEQRRVEREKEAVQNYCDAVREAYGHIPPIAKDLCSTPSGAGN